MRSFWIWFSLMAAAWLCAFMHPAAVAEELPWRMALSAVFFAVFFLSPLFRDKPRAQPIVLGAASVLAVLALWPQSGGAANPYTPLVLSLLAGEAVYRLAPIPAAAVGGILLSGAIAPGLAGYPSFPLLFLALYAMLHVVALTVFKKISNQHEDITVRNEALMSEYRKIKRQLVSDEAAARQEERVQIGRDIHDSVGHKLTALLMQLEVHRMRADGETAAVLADLKRLAKESLDETRSAVKALKQRETGGLAAILGLIRRLEAERFMRVNFTVKHGALSAPLGNTQSAAIFRAVQEALTNAMKHGHTREAEITFEAPGGGIFRFEVANPYKGDRPIREGFGLQSMRERIESVGGQLDILPYEGYFVVRGTLSMLRKGEGEA